MTCIAVDQKGYIAWDSQVTVEGVRMPYAFDKVWLADGKVYAFAGDVDVMDSVIEWHRRGAKRREAPAGLWSLFVASKRGMWIYEDDAPWKSTVTLPFAMGSGADFALGAMDAGVGAYRAVIIASKRDTGTGGAINVIEIAGALRK